MKTFALSQKGKTRNKNEDRFLIKEVDGEAILLAVADGMGGHRAGDVAAKIIIDSLASIKRSRGSGDDLLVDLVLAADHSILKQAEEKSDFERMGSTLTGILVIENNTHWVHVGDSRLYLLHEQKLTQITRDQNMAQFLADEGEIRATEVRTHPMRKLLEQYVGQGDCEPDTGRFAVEKGDLMVLTTDGLHGTLTSERMGTLLKKHSDIETKARSLVQASVETGANDDMTIVLMQI